MEKFGGDITASPSKQLVVLRQTDSVDEYVNEFHARVAQIPTLDHNLQLGMFLNSLQEEVLVKFLPNDANDLQTTIRVARSSEKELNFYAGDKKRSRYSSTGRSDWLQNNVNSSSSSTKYQDWSVVKTISCRKLDVPVRSTPITTSGSHIGSSSGSQHCKRQYSHQEYLDMKAEGLCFRFRQPYSPSHNCPYKSLRALMLAKDEVLVDGDILSLETAIQPCE